MPQPHLLDDSAGAGEWVHAFEHVLGVELPGVERLELPTKTVSSAT